MPALQLIKVPPLGVLLAQDDGGMFLCCDGTLLLEGRLGPLQTRDDRFQQPFHAQGVIMDVKFPIDVNEWTEPPRLAADDCDH